MAGIDGVQVDIHQDGVGFVGAAFTDINGDYSFEVPGDGDFFAFTPNYGIPIPYLPDVWDGNDGTYCPFQVCDIFTVGTPVIISGSSVSGINLALDTGFTISGNVTDASTTNPLEGVEVCIYLDDDSFTGSCGASDVSGNYTAPALPSASNYAAYAIPTGPYYYQAYNGVDCSFGNCDSSLATLIELGNPGDATGIDFDLNEAATISGTVTSSVDGLPVQPQARLHALTGEQLGAINGNADGTYTLPAIDPGTYYVLLNNRNGNLVDELYDNIPCPRFNCDYTTLGTQITLSAGEERTGIDAELDPGSRIGGSILLDGVPAAFASVFIYDAIGTYSGFGLSNGSGDYSSRSGLPAGSYYVVTGGPDSGVNADAMSWPGIPCGEPCDPTLGDLVVVNGTDDVGGIDFGLLTSGTASLSGTVVDEADGTTPVNPVSIDLKDPVTGAGTPYNANNNGDGTYVIYGIPPGDYKVVFINDSGEYIDELYDEVVCDDGTCDIATLGDVVTINPGPNTLDEDLALVDTTTLSGNITGSDTALPIEGIVLWLFDLDCNFLAGGATDVNGDYLVEAPGAGDFYIFAIGNDAIFGNTQTPYMNQQYPGINMFDSCYPALNDVTLGDVISLVEGEDAVNIDFVMDPGGEILGTVSDSGGVLPIGTGEARLFSEAGRQLTFAINKEGDGSYRLGGILPGTYRLILSSRNQSLIDERYDDVPCPRDSCDPGLGATFTFTGTESFTSIDATLDAGAEIRGTVTDLDSGLPVTNVCVLFYNETGVYVALACVDELGNYASQTGLPPGNYRMANQFYDGIDYSPVDGGYLPQVWTNDGSFLYCGEECDFLLGDTFTVTDTTPVEDIDLAMTLGYTISGNVIDASTTNPIEGANVCIHLITGEFTGSCGSTDINGDYEAGGLPPGSDYVAYAFAPEQGYKHQMWMGIDCDFNNCFFDQATPIELGNPGSTAGIDFDLSITASISGLVTDSTTMLGVQPQVRIHGLDGTQLGATTGAPDGTYTLGGIDPGTYYLLLNNRNGPLIDELYDDVQCPRFACDFMTLGTQITLTAGEMLTGIDAALDPGSRISGSVTIDGVPAPPFRYVYFYNDAGVYAGFGFTDASGDYISRSGFPAGSYYARTGGVDSGTGTDPVAWPNVPCGDPCDPTLGDLIPVNGADDATGIDFVLTSGGSGMISGTITADDGGAPLEDINVCASLQSDPGFVACSVTDISGFYSIGGLVPQPDYVIFTVDVGGQAYYREQYNDQPCCDPADGTPIDITGGNATIDMSLASSGLITGFVKDAFTDVGLPNVRLELYDPDCNRLDPFRVVTDDGANLGHYAISGVPDGTYYVYANTKVQGAPPEYINEFYPDEKKIDACFGDLPGGQAIVISDNTIVNGVDIALDVGGSISGSVSGPVGVLPLGQARIELFDDDDNSIDTYRNFNSGDNSYTIFGLPAGAYKILFYAPGAGLIDELYDDVLCPQYSCDPNLGVPIVVGPQENVTGIDATLEPGAVIQGRLTDALSGDGLPFQFVDVYTDTGLYAGFARSDLNGFYTTSGAFPPGDYFLSNQFVNPRTGAVLPVLNGYLPQVWTNDGSFRACGDPCEVLLGDPVTIVDISPVAGIDLAMEQGGEISGNVTFGGGPLASATVLLLNGAGQAFRSDVTDDLGNYAFDGLGSGDYFVQTANGLGYEDYLHAVPSDILCTPACNPFSGEIISLIPSSNVTGIDFTLTLAGAISGTVTESGAGALAGITVEVYNILGDLVDTSITNAAGEYLVTGLGTGTHFVRTRNTQGYADALYDAQGCDANCDVLMGAPVAVTAGTTSANIDLAMSFGGSIGGTAIADVNGEIRPLGRTRIEVYSPTGTLAGADYVDSDDQYEVSGLAAGDYFVVTRVKNSRYYLDEAAGGEPCPLSCDILATTPVTVSTGVNTPLNFTLGTGSSIQVYVTDSSNVPQAGVDVVLSNQRGAEDERIVTGPVQFNQRGQPFNAEIFVRSFTRYHVHVESDELWDEIYDDLVCVGPCDPTEGTLVRGASEETVTPLQMSLLSGNAIAGRVVEDGTSPEVPIPAMVVGLYKDGFIYQETQTDSDGQYAYEGLPDGDYQVRTLGEGSYIDEVYGGASCSPQACPIEGGTIISLDQSVATGIDFGLTTGGTIFGYARDPGNNVIYGEAQLFSSAGELIVRQSGISGNFAFTGIADGTYFIYLDAQSRYLFSESRCHYHYYGSGFRSYRTRHCVRYPVYSTGVDTLYAGLQCAGQSCDITTGTPVVLNSGGSVPGEGVSAQTNIEMEVVSGHSIRGSVRAWDNTPLAFVKVYFFTEAGIPAGEAFTNGTGDFVSSSAFPDGVYYAATNREAIASEGLLDGEDAEAGVPDEYVDQAWSGFDCEDICSPSTASGIGTPIVISGGDATGIHFILNQAPGISLEKLTNGIDADTPNGGEAQRIFPGSVVSWSYVVSNTGGDVLQNISVVDNQGVTVTCPQNTLAAGESMDCTGFGSAENLALDPFTGVIGNCDGEPGSRLYQNIATVTAETAGAIAVEDSDASHYCNPPDIVPDFIFGGGFE